MNTIFLIQRPFFVNAFGFFGGIETLHYSSAVPEYERFEIKINQKVSWQKTLLLNLLPPCIHDIRHFHLRSGIDFKDENCITQKDTQPSRTLTGGLIKTELGSVIESNQESIVARLMQ